MPRIQPLEITKASPAAQTAIQEHLRQGYRLTNEKRTLLHNAVAFEALEAQSYAVDKELQRLVGKRAADFFEYGGQRGRGTIVTLFPDRGDRYFSKGLYDWGGMDDAAAAE